MHSPHSLDERVVITGIGIVAGPAQNREGVWRAVQRGESAVDWVTGLPGLPDAYMQGSLVEVARDFPGQLKHVPLTRQATAEAIDDSRLDLRQVDLTRVGCSINGHIADTDYIAASVGRHDIILPGKKWWSQWLPNTTCATIAHEFGLLGTRISNSTACASGTIAILLGTRAIRDGQCDVVLSGSCQVIHPLFAAGFRNMGVLAVDEDPTRACRPFDKTRCGFVMGEGAAVLVLERLSHASQRNAPIYAEILSGHIVSEAEHVTSLNSDSTALSYVIERTLKSAHLVPADVQHINAHATGTTQNDPVEIRGIRRALGSSASQVTIAANKSTLGHLVNASGSVELALTALALRDGVAPPTRNLRHPDPECDLDCTPLVGRRQPMEHALKLSLAFGGHLAVVALRRWESAIPQPAAIETAPPDSSRQQAA